MRVRRVCMVSMVTALVGCGGSGGTDPEPPPGNNTAVFTTLQVTPSPVFVAVGGTQPLAASARDQNGGTMTGLTVTYSSNDQSRATVSNSGVVTGVAEGEARITATGTIGTVVRTATVTVNVVGSPIQAATVTATLASTFDPSTVVIGRGGSVTWTFTMQHNVTFEGSSAPASIPNTSTGSVSRTFPNVGTFEYDCTLHSGMSGRVIVL